MKTGCNLAESSKEGYGSRRAVLPMMMKKNDLKDKKKKKKNLSSIYVTSLFACCQVCPTCRLHWIQHSADTNTDTILFSELDGKR
jgi:hypothetical protein